MSDSKQTVLESLVNRAKHLENIKSKALARWSGCFRLANQWEQGEGAFFGD